MQAERSEASQTVSGGTPVSEISTSDTVTEKSLTKEKMNEIGRLFAKITEYCNHSNNDRIKEKCLAIISDQTGKSDEERHQIFFSGL